MAKKTRNEVAVGITVLVVLLLVVYIVMTLADWSSWTTAQQEITVQVPYKMGAKGLGAGSPVLLGGIKIGQIIETHIEKIETKLEGDQGINVFFTLRIPKKYELRRDCVLLPQSNVLGSQTVLSIENLGQKGAVIEDGQTVQLALADSVMDSLKREFNPNDSDSLLAQFKQIAAKINLQVTDDPNKNTLMNKFHVVADKLVDVVGRINDQLDSENKQAALSKLKVVLDKLDVGLGEIKELIETTGPDITSMVASLKNTASVLETQIPKIVAKANSALDSAKEALENLKDLSGTGKDILATNRQRIDRLIVNISEVATNLKLTSREVRRAPWKLLYRPKEKELKIQATIDSASAFAAGAERLDNTAISLQALIAGTGEKLIVDQGKIESMIAELEASFSQFQKAEQKFWKELE